MKFAILLFFAFAIEARADYIFSLTFDQLTANVPDTTGIWAADTISFSIPQPIPVVGEGAVASPGTTFDGFSLNSGTFGAYFALHTGMPDNPRLEVDGDGINFDGPAGAILAFFFYAPLPQALLVTNAAGTTILPGTYPTTLAGRDISFGSGNGNLVFYTSGSLTVTETPEPQTIVLALFGLGALLLHSFYQGRTIFPDSV
jgi:hypothetical protein